MKPSICRLVVYTMPAQTFGTDVAYPEERAALIVRVRHEPCACATAPCTVEEHHVVDLRVYGLTPQEDFAVAAAPFAPAVGALGCWTWPPRVA